MKLLGSSGPVIPFLVAHSSTVQRSSLVLTSESENTDSNIQILRLDANLSSWTRALMVPSALERHYRNRWGILTEFWERYSIAPSTILPSLRYT